MEKILLAIDVQNPDKNALDFACYLARLTKSRLTGVILENIVEEEKPVIKNLEGALYVDREVDEKAPRHKIKLMSIENCIHWFKQGCIARDTLYRLDRDGGLPAEEIISESRFSDLIVADAASSFYKEGEGIPSRFITDVLKKSECPVIIAPGEFDSVEEIVFAYDGSASSVFSIKQFTYLFPQFYSKPVSIVHVNRDSEWMDNEKNKFKEWLEVH